MIELPWPHKILWPNGRTLNRRYKAAETAKHKAWAFAATKAVHGAYRPTGERIAVRLTFYPKPRGPAPDKDNGVSSCKAYLDGIAQALGVNDSLFDLLPPLISTDRRSCIVVTIGEAA